LAHWVQIVIMTYSMIALRFLACKNRLSGERGNVKGPKII
jgi:hypothetical protein